MLHIDHVLVRAQQRLGECDAVVVQYVDELPVPTRQAFNQGRLDCERLRVVCTKASDDAKVVLIIELKARIGDGDSGAVHPHRKRLA